MSDVTYRCSPLPGTHYEISIISRRKYEIPLFNRVTSPFGVRVCYTSHSCSTTEAHDELQKVLQTRQFQEPAGPASSAACLVCQTFTIAPNVSL